MAPLNLNSNYTPSSMGMCLDTKQSELDRICFPFCESTNRLRVQFPKKMSLQSVSSLDMVSQEN